METRLLIIDEISFASKDDFAKINKRLQTLKQQLQKHHGGLDKIFSGDMRQLEPINRRPVYEENCPVFKDWANLYIELALKMILNGVSYCCAFVMVKSQQRTFARSMKELLKLALLCQRISDMQHSSIVTVMP